MVWRRRKVRPACVLPHGSRAAEAALQDQTQEQYSDGKLPRAGFRNGIGDGKARRDINPGEGSKEEGRTEEGEEKKRSAFRVRIDDDARIAGSRRIL